MKETRLGPRQWAFVVVAGGAVMALPFTQRQLESKPEPPVVDVAATLLPEVNLSVPSVVASTASHGTAHANAGEADKAGIAAASAEAFELANAPALPAWPTLPHSPFDDLVKQKAMVIDAQPTEDIVPMQPLRPWISAPGLVGHSLASTSSPSSSGTGLGQASAGSATSTPASGSSNNPAALASPWRDDGTDVDNASQQVVTSYGHGRRQLPVTAGPADQYTYEELAQKLNLPQQEMAKQELGRRELGNEDLGRQDLVSAIVPSDQVLPVPPVASVHLGTQAGVNPGSYLGSHPAALAGQSSLRSVPKSSVVLSRQPGLKAPATQIRFGQSESPPPTAAASSPAPDSPMVPLPSLPEERRGHMIFQPRRP